MSAVAGAPDPRGERHSARAARALARLAEADPAFGALALWCRHRDGAEDARPAWTDGETIWYGPRFAARGLDEQVGLAAHQILHVALRHPARAEAMRLRAGAAWDAELYAAAADVLVNGVLAAAGHVQPRPYVELADLLAELPGASAELADWDADRLYVALAAALSGRGGGDGDAGRRRARAALGDRLAERGLAPDLERPGRAGRVPEAGDAEWRERLARALEAGRIAGRGLGLLAARLGDLPRSDTPWEAVLRGLLTKAVTRFPRRTHARPARRWLALDSAARAAGRAAPVFEPGIAREGRRPRIAVALDASGSIDAARLARFAGEVAGVGRRTGAEVHVLVFDEAVRARRRMGGRHWESEITALEMPRGGGTSFVAVMAEALALEPSAIVVLTDLDGAFGPRPGRVPVIWAVPEPPAAPPPFGRVLSLAR